MEKILHITEVSSGGVLPVIANICNSLADDCHMAVAYGRRVDTPANIRDYFDKRIELIPIDCFRRELSIREDRKALYEIRRVVPAGDRTYALDKGRAVGKDWASGL